MKVNFEYIVRASEKMKIPCYRISNNEIFFNGKVYSFRGMIVTSGAVKMRFFNIRGLFENMLEDSASWSMSNVRSLTFFYENLERGAVKNSREIEAHRAWAEKNKPQDFSEKRG